MGAKGNGSGSRVLVQKYGGSSLATTEQIRKVADRIGAVYREGRKIAVVVSAQGNCTDDLQRLSTKLNPCPSGREMDQLLATGETVSAALMAMALQAIGIPAIALSGAQSGILATGAHGSGVIVAVDTERAIRLMSEGNVLVVAGFQGVDAAGNIITLGRGGSDTTAVAIAAELRTGHCEIYTDVDGVYTADPRVLPSARVMPTVDIDVMMEMSFMGAKVLHSRAVELAAMYGVDILVKNSSSVALGTVISSRNRGGARVSKAAVIAVVHDLDVARLVVRTSRANGKTAAQAFRPLAEHSVPADVEILSDQAGEQLSIGMTVRRSDTELAYRATTEIVTGCGGRVELDDSVGKLSIVGTGLLNRTDYISRMLSALAKFDISPTSISASQLRISVTVPVGDVVRAVGILHSEFELDSENSVAELARSYGMCNGQNSPYRRIGIRGA